MEPGSCPLRPCTTRLLRGPHWVPQTPSAPLSATGPLPRSPALPSEVATYMSGFRRGGTLVCRLGRRCSPCGATGWSTRLHAVLPGVFRDVGIRSRRFRHCFQHLAPGFGEVFPGVSKVFPQSENGCFRGVSECFRMFPDVSVSGGHSFGAELP